MSLADTLQAALAVAVDRLAVGLADALPRLFAAILLILLGWVMAVLLKRLALRMLKSMKFNEYLKSQKLDKALGSISISEVLGMVVYYYVLVLFFQAAFNMVYLATISDFIGKILLYVPVLIAAALLVVVAALTGEYLKMLILQLGDKSATVQAGSRVAKFLVIYIGVVMGLSTIGFNTEILNAIFISLSQAIFYGFALAFGIAFGLGGQEAANDWIKTARSKLIRA